MARARVKVKRARIRLYNEVYIWLPWWTVNCPCCVYKVNVIGRITALNMARMHASIHSPTIKRADVT